MRRDALSAKRGQADNYILSSHMLPEIDHLTLFLGSITLVLISIYTIEKCRGDKGAKPSDEQAYLFCGATKPESFASSMGMVFSATYFFGATFIYGHIFQGWLLLTTLAIFLVLIIIIPRIVVEAEKSLGRERFASRKSNILLDLLSQRLEPRDFAVMTRLYAIVYFLLLIEELAVTRLVFSTLFPFHPLVSALMLSTVCFVIMAYVYFGGFRATLISDFEQLKIMLLFVAVMAFMMYRDSTPALLAKILSLPRDTHYSGLIFAVIFGVSWFAPAVDFYSRLNYLQQAGNVLESRKQFSRISLGALCLFLFVGIIFGAHLRSIMPTIESPSSYTEASMAYFLLGQSRITAAAFFVGLFCMVFTTLNTLLLTLLQVGYYKRNSRLKRRHLVRIVLIAIVLSSFLRFDSVSAIGIFFGSLMILPAVGLAAALSKGRLRNFFSPSMRFLDWSLWLSAAIFLAFFDRLELSFEEHFLIPGIVVLSTIACLLCEHAVTLIKAARSVND